VAAPDSDKDVELSPSLAATNVHLKLNYVPNSDMSRLKSEPLKSHDWAGAPPELLLVSILSELPSPCN
jgi:hypothetical protein